MKKTLSILLALVMTMSLCCVSVYADAVYFEDFSDDIIYSNGILGNKHGNDLTANAPSLATGTNDVLNDTLTTSPTFGGGGWQTIFKIVPDQGKANSWGKPAGEDDVEGTAVLNISTYGAPIGAINVTKDFGSFENGFTYSADVRTYFNGNMPAAVGIRLANKYDETDYFELAMNPNSSYSVAGTARFVKNIDGTSAEAIPANGTANIEYVKDLGSIACHLYDGGSTKWFNLSISVVRNLVSYKIIDKVDGSVVASGSYVDTDNILADGFIPQCFAGGEGQGGLFDNIKVEAIEDSASGEVFTDNFDGYAVDTTTVTGKGQTLVDGIWVSNEGDLLSSGSTYTVTNESVKCNNWNEKGTLDNQVLLIGTSGTQGGIRLVKSLEESESGYTFSADVRNYLYNGTIQDALGIRLGSKDDATNYYELAILADNGGDNWPGIAPRFTKVQGAVRATPAIAESNDAWKYSDFGDSAIDSGFVPTFGGTYWFNLSMSINGNKVSWKITDKDGVVVWADSFTDSEDFLAGGIVPQLFAYGHKYGVFDNVSWGATPVEKTNNSVVAYEEDFEAMDVYVQGGNLGADYDNSNNIDGLAAGHRTFIKDVWGASAAYSASGWSSESRLAYSKHYGNTYNNNDYDDDNKAILMDPITGKGVALNLIKDLGDTSGGFAFSADIRNYMTGSINESTGIRLVDKTNEANYYELALTGNLEESVYGVRGVAKEARFTKVTGGTLETTAYATDDSAFDFVARSKNAVMSDLQGGVDTTIGTVWFNMTLAVKGNTVYWTVVNNKTGAVEFEGSQAFDDAIDVANLMPQVYTFTPSTGNPNRGKAYADNIKVVKNGIAMNKASATSAFYDMALVGAGEDAVLVAAYYDAYGTLLYAEPMDIAGEGFVYSESAIAMPEGADKVKLFAIDGFESLAPICPAAELEF